MTRPLPTRPSDRARRPRRLPGPVRLAPRAGADRLPRRRRVAGRARAARRRDLGGRARLPVRPRAGPGDGRPGRATRGAARAFFGADGGPAAAPAAPNPVRGRPRRVPRRRLAGGQMNAQHPRQFGYFTPPPLPMSIMGELLAQMTNQGVDVWHAGPFAAFVEEEVVRWLCDLVGYGPDVVRAAHVGRRDGQLHGDGPRPRRPPRAAARRRPAAARRAARGRPRLHLRPDPLLDRPRARRARVPARDARRHRVRRPRSTSAARRSRRRSRATGRPGSRRSPSPPSPARRTPGSVDAIGELADVAAAEDLWLHVDAAYGGAARLSARDAGRVPDLERADSVTVDPHKWFFQAYDIGGLLVRDGRHLGEARSAAARPSTTAAARRPARPAARTTTTTGRRPAQLLQARLRGHPPLARAQAVDVVEAPRHRGLRPARRGERRPRGAPRPPLRRGRRLRGAPGGARAVGRLLPPPARRAGAALALPPASSTPTRTGSRRRSRYPATAG